MNINKQYTIIGEALAKVANKAFKEEEKDLGELLTLIYTCYLLGVEKDLLDMIKEYRDSSDWEEYNF